MGTFGMHWMTWVVGVMWVVGVKPALHQPSPYVEFRRPVPIFCRPSPFQTFFHSYAGTRTASTMPFLKRLRGGGDDDGSEDDGSERDSTTKAQLEAADDVRLGLLQDVPERISLPRMEEKILDYWDETGALEQSEAIAKAANRTPWIFFDGPPFATGMPHYGHILAGTIKDVMTRFWSQNGRLVERKWGWDCHGLPIEYEVEQALGIKSRDDVLKMGIPAFNAECRRVVMRYASEWKRVVRRLARWINMDNDYKTLDTPYMESVWWTCKQLFEKKLLYRGFKVMPYSLGCMTGLSNFEANLNYKDVSDPAIIVRFPLVDDPQLSLLVWTTTPWTIPSNLAICVNAESEYVEVRDNKSAARLLLMKTRLPQLYGKAADKSCTILNLLKGSALVGWQDFFSTLHTKC
jgi:isoleucyl-tRNA synthetase